MQKFTCFCSAERHGIIMIQAVVLLRNAKLQKKPNVCRDTLVGTHEQMCILLCPWSYKIFHAYGYSSHPSIKS